MARPDPSAPATLAEALPGPPVQDTARPADLQLPAELTIYTAAEARSAWLGWLAGDLAEPQAAGCCRVDAAAVGEVDSAGAQLLVALSHSLARQRLRLQLVQPSAPLRQACADLGLAGHLGLDAEAAA